MGAGIRRRPVSLTIPVTERLRRLGAKVATAQQANLLTMPQSSATSEVVVSLKAAPVAGTLFAFRPLTFAFESKLEA